MFIKGVCAKNLVDSSKASDSTYREKTEQIQEANVLPKETVTAIIMLYKNAKAMVYSPDGDTNFFEILLESCKEMHERHIRS